MKPERADWSHRFPTDAYAVYALCWEGEVVYVGQSKSIHMRIMQHRNRYRRWVEGKGVRFNGYLAQVVRFDEAWVRYCEEEDLDRVEWEMIQKYKPELNKALKPMKKAEYDVRTGKVRIDLEKLGLNKWTTGSKRSSRDFVRRV